jgi:RNAse (barnase) inhibitor barstar
MTAFSTSEENDNCLDYTILRDGSIALYRRADFLEEDVNWLRSNGYKIVSFDCSGWHSEEHMHDSLEKALSFPSYYGRNLDALDECMCEDVEVPDTDGLVLVLRHYDRYSNGSDATHGSERSVAEIMLHIFAKASRSYMLTGRRLLSLVQSNDPAMRFDHLAAVAATWNRRE